jgi:hypothetical protein
MIIAPKCWIRNCKYYLGVKSDDECELNERVYCHAYPDGIPHRIAHGRNKHLTIQKDQDNDIVFKRKLISWSALSLIKDIYNKEEVSKFARENNATVENVITDWTEFNRYEIVPVIEIDKNGEMVFNLCSDAASDDWIRAGRLRRKAEAGDEEARKELEELENTPMYRLKKGNTDD